LTYYLLFGYFSCINKHFVTRIWIRMDAHRFGSLDPDPKHCFRIRNGDRTTTLGLEQPRIADYSLQEKCGCRG
jgi:hypothetical protein